MILNSPYISGSLTVTGNEVVTGSLTVLGGITGAITGSATSASYASNAELLDGLDSSVFVLSSSFQNYSSSNDGKVAALNTFSASILSYTSSTDDKIAQLNRETASLNLATASLYAATSSIYNFTSSANLRIGSLEQYTQSLNTRSASFACVDSTNNFACTQYFSNASNAVSFTSTGSLYSDGGMRITKDLYVSGTSYFNNVTVFGTQSVAYISSSQLNIGTNIISVNTDTPSIRFGGLAVYDSGSTGLTGSILWDSEANHWVYTNPSGSTYSGGMFISGPRASSLGTEQGTTSCALMMGQGGDHITSSAIFHYGNATCFYGNASITSAGAACFNSSVTAGGGVRTTGANGFSDTDGTSTIWMSANWTSSTPAIAVTTNHPLMFLTNNTERFRITAAGVACFSNQICAQGATFTTTGNTAVTIASGATGLSRLVFQGTVGNSRGFIDYDNSTCGFIIRTNENTALTISCLGNLGLGVNPSAWRNIFNAFQVGYTGTLYAIATSTASEQVNLASNYYQDSAGNELRIQAGFATRYQQASGEHRWSTAGTSSAGSGISFTQAMTLNACGRLILGNTTDNTFSRLQVAGGAWIGQNAGRGLYFADGASYTSVVGVNQAVSSYNAIELRASGVDGQLFLATSGNVGIGTVNPSDTLTITDASTYTFNIGAACGGAGAVLYTLGSAALTFATCGKSNERVRITSAGKVAINETVNFDSLLNINTKTCAQYANTFLGPSSQIRLTNGAACIGAFSGISFGGGGATEGFFGIVQNSSCLADFVWQTFNGSAYGERMRITSGGNVGIGNTNPNVPLDVQGNIRIRGASSSSYLLFNTDGSTNNYGGIEVNNDISNGTSMRFYNLTSGTLTEKMRITSGGVACFACTVCAPTLNLNSQNGLGFFTGGRIIDSYFVGGPVGGNNALQTFYTVPAAAKAVLVIVQGNFRAGVENNHNGYNQALFVMSGCRIHNQFVVPDTSQGQQSFCISYSGGNINVCNNNSMANTQSGDSYFIAFG